MTMGEIETTDMEVPVTTVATVVAGGTLVVDTVADQITGPITEEGTAVEVVVVDTVVDIAVVTVVVVHTKTPTGGTVVEAAVVVEATVKTRTVADLVVAIIRADMAVTVRLVVTVPVVMDPVAMVLTTVHLVVMDRVVMVPIIILVTGPTRADLVTMPVAQDSGVRVIARGAILNLNSRVKALGGLGEVPGKEDTIIIVVKEVVVTVDIDISSIYSTRLQFLLMSK